MPTPSFEQIIVLMIFILAPLINFVMQRVRRRLEPHVPPEESVTQMRRQQPQPTLPPSLVRREARERPPPRAQAATVSAPIRRARFIKKSLLGDIRDVRRGIILMTVLGSCRAFDPPD